MDCVRVSVMKTVLNKRVSVLPFLFPIMLALTSCSTIGQHQSVSATSGGVVAPQHTSHTYKPHHVRQISHQEVKIASTHKQSYQAHPVTATSPANQYKPAKSTPVAKAKPVSGVKVAPKTKPVAKVKAAPESKPVSQSSVKPIATWPGKVQEASNPSSSSNQMWLLSVDSIDLNPGIYKNTGRNKEVIVNINRLDSLDGNRHYIQAARWSGDHVSQAYINARDAALLTVVGLGVLENGYIETNFGTTIMMLGGNGHIKDISGNRFELLVTRAAQMSAPGKATPAVKSKKKPATKRANVSLSDHYDFTIGENEVVTILDAKLNKMANSVSANSSGSQEAAVDDHCASANLSLLSQAICSVHEANNNISAVQACLSNEAFCGTDANDVPAKISAEFGNRTLSAN